MLGDTRIRIVGSGRQHGTTAVRHEALSTLLIVLKLLTSKAHQLEPIRRENIHKRQEFGTVRLYQGFCG